MSKHMSIQVVCPYCGNKVWRSIKPKFYYDKVVVSCSETSAGGCDQDFVLDIKVSREIRTLKIEGESEYFVKKS